MDVLIVLLHWGQEFRPQMNNLQRQVAQHLTSLGVQLVIGCHPHVQEPYSYHGNRFVAYSLGNLLFLNSKTPEKFKVSGGPNTYNNIEGKMQYFLILCVDDWLRKFTMQTRTLDKNPQLTFVVTCAHSALRSAAGCKVTSH